jgi:hypothetical protein
MRPDRVGPGGRESPATNPVLPASAAAGFRAKEPSLPVPAAGRGVPASAAGQGCPMPAVFPSSSAARAAATRPSQRAVQVGSPPARQEARRLVARSAGRPLDPAEASLAEATFTAGGVLVHDDALAKRAAVLLGAHAFALGDHLYLGPTVGTSEGPSRGEALRHELAHRAQGALGAVTGQAASRPALEGQAHALAKGRRLERDLLGADPSELHEWLWIPALLAAGYILLDPDPANAPGPGDTVYPPKNPAQRAAEGLLFALPAGRLAAGGASMRTMMIWGGGSAIGSQAVGDLGRSSLSPWNTYAGRGAAGAIGWGLPMVPMNAFATGARGLPLFGSFAGYGAATGLGLRASGDLASWRRSPVEDYLLWGGGGAGLGLLSAGGVRGLDAVATRGAVASDILLSESLAARAPVGPASVEAAQASTPWWGRAAHGYLASRNWVVLYRGQGATGGEVLSPLARGPGGLAASEAMLVRLRAAGLSEEEIAGFTAKFGPELVPGSFLPPELQGLGGQSLGGAGIPVTRLPGVAADFASGSAAELAAQGLPANPLVLVVRAPAGEPISALNAGWGSKSLVEQEFILLHRIPGGTIVQRIPPARLPHLRAGYDAAGRDVLEWARPGVPRVR